MGTEKIELSPNANREAGQLNTYIECNQLHTYHPYDPERSVNSMKVDHYFLE